MNDQSEIAATPSLAIEPPAGGAGPEPEECRFTFTGSGKEYFRIWIVNLLLSVVTLGIYSAWAKVRRLQYFDRNTVLAGASFDFHGDPKAILKGRLLGVGLLAVYHYAFGFSVAFGAVVATVLFLALPYLLRGALRFRLSNTTYRALPLDFSGSLAGAYLSYLPPIATVLLPGILVAFDPAGRASALAFLLYLGWPLMHASMKRYQHANLLYGAEASTYAVPARRFLAPYLRAVLFGLLAMIMLSIVIGVLIYLLNPVLSSTAAPTIGVVIGAVSAYGLFLMTGPYLQVRIGNLAWSNTGFRGVRIRSSLSARAMTRLQLANAALTLLTLGLYRPFAVVRLYRYRLACVSLLAQDGFETIAAGAAQRSGAGGDAVAELLGFDLSW
jgi:uncharacterized membrane protein YjgN (DUF898 family)